MLVQHSVRIITAKAAVRIELVDLGAFHQVGHSLDQQSRIVGVVGRRLDLENQLHVVLFITTLADVGDIAFVFLSVLAPKAGFQIIQRLQDA